MSSFGTVCLVGAGPGDPELITVKALKRLRVADVVIYDRLISKELLREAREDAEMIFVGKAAGKETISQEHINSLVVERARSGASVVRLKGGDPFVFGRGAEEAEACARAGIECEVISGVSSALAAPLSAGIPLTHRGVSGNFAVVTAHRASECDALPWDALAQMDTLVILMGVGRMAEVTGLLMDRGKSSVTPAAVIERATYDDQRVVIGTLSNIAERSEKIGIRPPATVIVGEVVGVGAKIKELKNRVEGLVKGLNIWQPDTLINDPDKQMVMSQSRA